MLRALLLCITLTRLNALSARAADVLILQSSSSHVCTEARGFHAASMASYKTTSLSDNTEFGVERIVKEEWPRLAHNIGGIGVVAGRQRAACITFSSQNPLGGGRLAGSRLLGPWPACRKKWPHRC